MTPRSHPAVHAITVLREHLRTADDVTDEDIRAALTEVTDAYDGLVSEFCKKPRYGDEGYSKTWDAWNILGSGGHYAFLQTATRKP